MLSNASMFHDIPTDLQYAYASSLLSNALMLTIFQWICSMHTPLVCCQTLPFSRYSMALQYVYASLAPHLKFVVCKRLAQSRCLRVCLSQSDGWPIEVAVAVSPPSAGRPSPRLLALERQMVFGRRGRGDFSSEGRIRAVRPLVWSVQAKVGAAPGNQRRVAPSSAPTACCAVERVNHRCPWLHFAVERVNHCTTAAPARTADCPCQRPQQQPYHRPQHGAPPAPPAPQTAPTGEAMPCRAWRFSSGDVELPHPTCPVGGTIFGGAFHRFHRATADAT